MTAEEAVRQAEAEGVTLLPSESSSTGYKGVVFISWYSKTKPYQARVTRAGKKVYLGSFVTAEEAALCYARSPEGRAASASAVPPVPPPMTAEEAVWQAEEEGVTLLPSESSSTLATRAWSSTAAARPSPTRCGNGVAASVCPSAPSSRPRRRRCATRGRQRGGQPQQCLQRHNH